jgi:tetratricopeptide (TPR) repeat protein
MRATRLFAALLMLFLARAACAHDDVRVTLDRLEKLARATPSDLTVLLRHAELSRLAGDSDAARRDLDTLEARAPRLPGAFLLRAALARDAGRPAEAVAQVDRFLAVSDGVDDATVSRAFALRAEAHAALRENMAALEDWDRAFSLSPAPPADWALARARLAVASGLDALPALERALERMSDEPSLVFLAADLDTDAGRVDAAVARLDRLAARCAQPAAILARSGDLLARAGRSLDAEARWTEALARLEGDGRAESSELAALRTRLIRALDGEQP